MHSSQHQVVTVGTTDGSEVLPIRINLQAETALSAKGTLRLYRKRLTGAKRLAAGAYNVPIWPYLLLTRRGGGERFSKLGPVRHRHGGDVKVRPVGTSPFHPTPCCQ